ncbi:hypothetical protein H5410_015155 [Solanum commersonii]|uniref:Uncharacterized protein n=1 Tax=Solanum commersonii TaxID=4109 RepID=A0A9J5ZTA8_SOLCO|nr:hypothetical protein H5410_015155 [Solanum commersonii]
MDHFLEYLPDLYKIIPPFCIIGVLDDEDPYDDPDELGDDLPLPRLDNLTNLIIQIDDKFKSAKQVSEQASTSKQPDVPIQRPPKIQDFILRLLHDL